ncbi:MAG: FMN-binding protein [Lentisphaerae bacterium]|jgi:Na+-transporting NADH:ubiquinone oxidoreductase subunit C|nr:FMN-binding protein [Lentisphaerota bacterium]MBT4816158.1 FMN-binding protein [Lentisphaerota bacterium]MBT5605569.1 FMN-binding protein [Lentisphaerota bacterium]MBT7056846.1 FMN-binding protein [Lentisphaerota bacterium]MBT7845368.1 FMN-binding protein [Lentisphaerota bacterium]
MNDRKMILFLLATTTACTLLLAGANLAYTRAAAVFNLRLYETILELFDVPVPNEGVEDVFRAHFNEQTVGGTVYYTSKQKSPGTVVFKAEGAGLWSRVELLLAVSASGNSLYGMRVLSQAETPGLGGRIGEPEFQARFRGVDVRPKVKLVKFAMGGNEIDAISGATMTSRAVERIINNGIADADRALGRE